ncbi:DUF2878 domain-containing protein [Marinomonas piezotolerans]|uniref:DUF2878 domain-containing protein n=1 Tax=Marinomonas piezotolerans TaxID=2213058 RepID=A0A370UCA2_9GAMM|nr:DUF2878 domain-containing protein [Marinomonas piezotolerans]RDL45426.1 DUF2878 domain-containing protein [Marinomonas piezotolerans]
MKSLINAAAFQVLWFACVLGGDDWGVAALILYLLFHHYYFVTRSTEWYLILLFIALGIAIDGALIFGGWISMPPSIWPLPIPPPWLLGLWAGVGSLFFHCLRWGQRYPWILSSMAAISAPGSYVLGADLAQVSLAEPMLETLVLMGFIWFWVVQVGILGVRILEKDSRYKS